MERNKPTSGSRLLHERQVSAEFGFSRGQLRRWRRLGRGPVFLRFGRRMVRYRRRDLEKFIAAHLVGKRNVGDPYLET